MPSIVSTSMGKQAERDRLMRRYREAINLSLHQMTRSGMMTPKSLLVYKRSIVFDAHLLKVSSQIDKAILLSKMQLDYIGVNCSTIKHLISSINASKALLTKKIDKTKLKNVISRARIESEMEKIEEYEREIMLVLSKNNDESSLFTMLSFQEELIDRIDQMIAVRNLFDAEVDKLNSESRVRSDSFKVNVSIFVGAGGAILALVAILI
ncbi:MAG: hypothetical protein JJU26_12985 [Oceanicaulis sp.]|nr:hypothetical protein [Oceanicaulis sp.]